MKRVSMVLACAAMLLAMPAVASNDVASELAEMRELVQGLQQKVDAQEEQIEQQGQLLEEAQGVLMREEDTRSGLSAFLDSIEVDGHIAGSYNYNFNTPDRDFIDTQSPFKDGDDEPELDSGTDVNVGESGFFLPFHRDHNTFTIDQIWFGIGKPATEESRGGFRFDMFFGQNANFLGQGGLLNNNGDLTSRRSQNLDGTSDYYVAQAYVEYQCGCFGPEINWKFGKFQTLVGAEVVQAPANFNVTRGILYGLQPVDHLGLLASTPIGDMVTIDLGIVNSIASGTSSPDFNKEKGYIGSVLVGDDKLNLRTSFLYGAEGELTLNTSQNEANGNKTNSTRTGLVDIVAEFNPTENVSLWANYDHLYVEGTGYYANGVSLAGRVQVTEKIGAALRGEYLREHTADSVPGDEDLTGILGDEENQEVYSLTATGDYKLTDHLMMRGEFRFDWIDSPGEHGEGFFANKRGEADNQSVGLLEVIYTY